MGVGVFSKLIFSWRVLTAESVIIVGEPVWVLYLERGGWFWFWSRRRWVSWVGIEWGFCNCMRNTEGFPLEFWGWGSKNGNDAPTRVSKSWLYVHLLDRWNTTLGQRPIEDKGCVLWNKLPSELQEAMSVNRFKSLLKLHLLNCIDYKWS